MNRTFRRAIARPSAAALAACTICAMAFAGAATAATVTSGSVPFSQAAAPGDLRLGFALQDLETPAEFTIDLEPGELITNVSINVIAPPSPLTTFSAVEQLGILFRPEAILTSSDAATWNQMAVYNNTNNATPTVAPASVFPNYILLDTSSARFQDNRVEIDEVTGFSIGGSDFTLIFDPNGIDVAAVPLPPAVWLLASGLVGAAVVGRKKKTRAS